MKETTMSGVAAELRRLLSNNKTSAWELNRAITNHIILWVPIVLVDNHVDDVSSLRASCCELFDSLMPSSSMLFVVQVIDQRQTNIFFREETIMLFSSKWRYASWHLFAILPATSKQTTTRELNNSREFLVWLDLLRLKMTMTVMWLSGERSETRRERAKKFIRNVANTPEQIARHSFPINDRRITSSSNFGLIHCW